jgi:hypothetical protein
LSKFGKALAAFCEKHPTLNKSAVVAENVIKKPVFGCQDCGQCVLSYDAFTCPMRCPKQIRNGPCGGTRADGHCEVYADRHCIWWLIYERSKKQGRVTKLRKYHIPVNRQFEHTSAWLNVFAEKILPMDLSKEYKEEDWDQPRKPKDAEEIAES